MTARGVKGVNELLHAYTDGRAAAIVSRWGKTLEAGEL